MVDSLNDLTSVTSLDSRGLRNSHKDDEDYSESNLSLSSSTSSSSSDSTSSSDSSSSSSDNSLSKSHSKTSSSSNSSIILSDSSLSLSDSNLNDNERDKQPRVDDGTSFTISLSSSSDDTLAMNFSLSLDNEKSTRKSPCFNSGEVVSSTIVSRPHSKVYRDATSTIEHLVKNADGKKFVVPYTRCPSSSVIKDDANITQSEVIENDGYLSSDNDCPENISTFDDRKLSTGDDSFADASHTILTTTNVDDDNSLQNRLDVTTDDEEYDDFRDASSDMGVISDGIRDELFVDSDDKWLQAACNNNEQITLDEEATIWSSINLDSLHLNPSPDNKEENKFEDNFYYPEMGNVPSETASLSNILKKETAFRSHYFDSNEVKFKNKEKFKDSSKQETKKLKTTAEQSVCTKKKCMNKPTNIDQHLVVYLESNL